MLKSRRTRRLKPSNYIMMIVASNMSRSKGLLAYLHTHRRYPVDFSLSEEQRLAVDGWRRHLQHHVAPITSAFLDRPFPKDVAHELLRLTIPYGVGCGWIPEADGGAGLDFLTSGLLFEELSR